MTRIRHDHHNHHHLRLNRSGQLRCSRSHPSSHYSQHRLLFRCPRVKMAQPTMQALLADGSVLGTGRVVGTCGWLNYSLLPAIVIPSVVMMGFHPATIYVIAWARAWFVRRGQGRRAVIIVYIACYYCWPWTVNGDVVVAYSDWLSWQSCTCVWVNARRMAKPPGTIMMAVGHVWYGVNISLSGVGQERTKTTPEQRLWKK